MAAQLHAGQFRKASSIPYTAHLLAVTALVLEHGGDEDEAIASLLHDAVEDQGGPPVLAEIERRFGQAVARIVEGCTDTDQSPKPPWRERKEAHIAHVHAAPRSVQLVVAADKLHNVRSMIADYRRLGPGLWSRFTASGPETLWYYRAMANVLRAGIGGELVKDLDASIAELAGLVAVGETARTTD
jgi:(p)ppGpp synthase/HD superfamily hydrolase